MLYVFSVVSLLRSRFCSWKLAAFIRVSENPFASLSHLAFSFNKFTMCRVSLFARLTTLR